MSLLRFRGIGLLLIIGLILITGCSKKKSIRQDILLNEDWLTIANDTDKTAFNGFEDAEFSTKDWLSVDVPHNWDDYGGYRRMMHGNRHGYAWYRKEFSVEKKSDDKRYFLFFEGVGSYATVWVNGQKVGYHAGGRTTFTLDITDVVKFDQKNILAVRADHPADIRDLPWVCGGCSPEWGFSEGSQPMGIFRPVHLVVTNSVRVEPFGVHIWNDNQITKEKAHLNIEVELKNCGSQKRNIELVNSLKDALGNEVAVAINKFEIAPGVIDTISQELNDIHDPHLWSVENPYLYHMETKVYEDNKLVDEITTPYGIRWIKWDIKGDNATNRFYLNDEPVFINGTAEYEHILGQSHAFSDEQVQARVDQILSMGYNSFRDAHQPHNFRYHEAWDQNGILWWTQMAAHIWFDTPEFRENFKTLLRDWVKERRNSPSIILWGLENESTLPEDFAKECSDIIRELDPTTSSQRLVTTCNGGSGTDWNVIQNWSGTYGGKPEIYDEEISKQLLNGEYGAWRSIDLHSEGEFDANGVLSEDRMTLLMESKIRLAEKASDKCCGQYHWLFNSHDNPGRTQGGEGFRDIDRLGPINYKGAVSIWGEPLDVFYMFRSNYVDNKIEPMVYIASHTWPDRWTESGIKDGIRVYSNCDEVELFNGVNKNSLGRKKRGGIGTHFVFNQVDIQSNVLCAVGYVDGEKVAEDYIVLHHLLQDPDIKQLQGEVTPLMDADSDWNTIYRVNCGGSNYTDKEGNVWMADVHNTGNDTWGSLSWTDDYPGLPAFYGSQRQTHDPIEGTDEWPLIQTFRYGRHKLKYHFPVQDGKYKVDMYFVEPWYGTGGGLDCNGWRIFDVAVNNNTVIDDLDIWQEVGHDKLLKKTFEVDVKGGSLDISFPKVKSGQAVVSAIAISALDSNVKAAPSSESLITNLKVEGADAKKCKAETWMDTGIKQFSDSEQAFSYIPPVLYGAEWIKGSSMIQTVKGKAIASFKLTADADVYIGIDSTITSLPSWMKDFLPSDKTIESVSKVKAKYILYQKKFLKGETVELFPVSDDKEQKMYVVAAVPVSTLDKAIDLRKSVSYQAEDGKHWGNARQVKFMKKDCIIVPDKNGSIGFVFKVGLASKYGLQFRFMNMANHEVDADVEILAADGRLMWDGTWTFPSANIKWKSFRTDTQTTINAGTYTIKITPKEKVPLYFDWVKVQ